MPHLNPFATNHCRLNHIWSVCVCRLATNKVYDPKWLVQRGRIFISFHRIASLWRMRHNLWHTNWWCWLQSSSDDFSFWLTQSWCLITWHFSTETDNYINAFFLFENLLFRWSSHHYRFQCSSVTQLKMKGKKKS